MSQMQKVNPNVVLGFDFGMKYLGIAAGQKISLSATAIATLRVKSGMPVWDEITALIDAWRPFALLVGLPLNMDGSTQDIALAAEQFATELGKKYNLPVHMIDERLSTWEAKRQLKLNKPRLNKQELEKINGLAAVLLTEQWLSGN